MPLETEDEVILPSKIMGFLTAIKGKFLGRAID